MSNDSGTANGGQGGNADGGTQAAGSTAQSQGTQQTAAGTQADGGGQQTQATQITQQGQQGGQQQTQGQTQDQTQAQGKTESGKAEPWWRDTITDPALKNVAERFTSPADAIKAIVDLRTDNSKRIKVPDAGASDEDKAKFRKALGVPDKPDGYKITAPDGIEMSDADKQVLEAVLPIAHEAGIPQATLNGFVSKFLELQRDMVGQTMQRLQEFGKQSEAQLKREWGQDFDANVNLANRAAEGLGGPELKAFLNQTPLATGGMLGDHPVIVKFLATLGRRTGEGDMLLGPTPQERSSIQDQINELNRQVPVGSRGYTSAEHQQKLQALYDKLHGKAPIVGSQGRAA